ncbi:MAG: alpha/beta fold hydrolase [Acidimicrobiales bacterium]
MPGSRIHATRETLFSIEHHATAGGSDPALLVVLVHGSLDRATSFTRVLRRLGDMHVIAYDRRGYHRSRSTVAPAGPPAELSGHVDDLLGIVDGRPSVVVGHSYGGDVAIGAAILDPAAVRAVVAYEPPLPWCEWWPQRSRAPLDGEDPTTFAEGFFKRMVGEAAWDRLTERDRDERRADGPALLAELAGIRRGGPPFDPAWITVPAVFGRGGKSVPHHRRAAATLAAGAPYGELFEIPGAGHGAHLSHPEAFAQMVRLALRRAGERATNPLPP